MYAIGPVLVAAANVPGPILSFWRMWMGVAILGLATVLFLPRTSWLPTRPARKPVLFAGICFGGNQLLIMSALRRASVIDVTLVGALQPLVVGAVAAWLLSERQNRAFRVWSGVAVAGALIVALSSGTRPTGDLVGIALATAAMFAYVGFFFSSIQARRTESTLTILNWTMLVGAVFVSGYVAAAGLNVTTVARTDLLLAAGVAVLPGAIGHFCMTWPLDRIPANVPPVMRLASPVIAGFIAWVALGQEVVAIQVAGGLVTMIGAAGAIASREPAPTRVEIESDTGL